MFLLGTNVVAIHDLARCSPKASYHARHELSLTDASFIVVNLVTADLAEISEFKRVLGFNSRNNSVVTCKFRHVQHIIDALVASAFDRALCQTDARNDRTCDLLTQQIANGRL